MTQYNLFPKPSLLYGLASLGNLSGTMIYDDSKTPEEADFKAVSSDWKTVGDDIRKAINQYDK